MFSCKFHSLRTQSTDWSEALARNTPSASVRPEQDTNIASIMLR